MGNYFKGVIGWEKFAGEWWLRMELSEPHVATVWPGSPSLPKPEGEQRRLTEKVLTLAEVRSAVTDSWSVVSVGFSKEDIKLLGRALDACPGGEKGKNAKRAPRHQPPGPDLY
jgi:hypothetical protein